MTTANPKHLRWFTWCYLIGISCSMLVSYTDLLDYTLLPRFWAASLCLLVSGIFLIIKRNSVIWPSFSWPLILLLTFFTWTSLSISWASSFSEAVYESQKGLIGLGAFYMAVWLQHNDTNFIKRFLYMMSGISIVALLLGAKDLLQVDWNGNEGVYAVKGISGHKNLFSTALFLLAAFQAMGWYILSNKGKYVSGVLFFANVLLILILQTRSTYLALLVTGMVYCFINARFWFSKKVYVLFLKVLTLSLVLSVASGIYLWKSGQANAFFEKTKIAALWQSQTGHERMILWKKTLCVIKQYPVLGVGVGNWQIQYPSCSVNQLYSVELDNTTFQRPHNDWLWVWAETGILGLGIYLAFFILILLSSWKKIKKSDNSPNDKVLFLRLSFIVGFMIIACFSFPKERIELLLLGYTLMGLWSSPLLIHNKTLQSRKLHLFILGILILGCSLSLYIGFQRAVGESAMKKALIYKQQKNWSAVIEQSDKAFSIWYTIDPTSIPIHWYRGTASFVKGNHKEALTDFSIAKKYAPYNQHVNNDLGSSYEMNGQRAKAKAAYLESIRVSPLFDDPRLNLGILYYNEGNYQEALDWVNSIKNHEVKMKYRQIIEQKIQEQQ